MHLVLGLLALVRPGSTASPSRRRQRTSTQTGPGAPTGVRLGSETGLIPVYLAAVFGGSVLALAWLLPETGASALLGWVAALFLVYMVRARRAYFPAYCAGLVGHVLGFYWVY